MLTDIKKNLQSSRVYFWQLLAFDILILLIFNFLVEHIYLHITLILLLIIASLIFLNIIGRKRRKEFLEIRSIIDNIRNNFYTNSSEIVLSKNLSMLQEDIKLMFEKTKSDIEYLKKLQRVRTEFIANVSHELRTPIFAVQGYIETLLNGAINDENVNKYFLEKANQHTINLNNLLNDLIDISMIESGEMRMSFRYFDLMEYLKNLIEELQPMVADKNISLILHPCRENLQIFGDKNKLRQVFINLIQNAIKYTEEGSVEVIVEEEAKSAKVIIRDTGIGIPEEDLQRIFERFYRVDKARSRSVGGTGLGLAIVKHILDAHSAKVEVKSKLNEGSEFSFLLKK